MIISLSCFVDLQITSLYGLLYRSRLFDTARLGLPSIDYDPLGNHTLILSLTLHVASPVPIGSLFVFASRPVFSCLHREEKDNSRCETRVERSIAIKQTWSFRRTQDSSHRHGHLQSTTPFSTTGVLTPLLPLLRLSLLHLLFHCCHLLEQRCVL